MEINIYGIILIAIIMITQASWIFYDASKRNENKWLWGFFGLIHCPSSLIIYLLITRKLNAQVTCSNCLYSIKEGSRYCSYCGHDQSENEEKNK